MSRLTGIVAKVLKMNEKKVRDDTSPLTVPAWDSFGGLLLITEVEKGYKIKFSIDEVLSIKSVGDIKKLLRKRSIDPDH